MKKLLSLSLMLITLCIILAGCKDSIEEDEVNNSVEEQITNNKIYGSTEKESFNNSTEEQVVNDNDMDNQESYIEVDIADLSDQVRDFSYGKGWYLDNSTEEWTCINGEGNILFSLPFGYEPVNGFIQNLCLVQHEGYKDIVIDESGNQVFADMTTGDNEILKLSENNGLVNIWIRIIKDTYDGHSEILRVIDGEGMTVSEYMSLQGLPFDTISRYSLRDLGDGMYQCGGYVFNTNNNSCFRYEDDFGLIEDVLNFDDGYGVGGDGKLIDSNGSVCFSSPSQASVGKYGDGVFFVGYWEEIFITGKYYDTYRGAFYNSNGQVELDISQYSLEDIPSFKEGYCVIRILNEAGVSFAAVIDKNGEFLFEPVEGRLAVEISEGMVVVNGDLIQMYEIKQNTTNTISDNIKKIGAFQNGWATFEMSSGNKGFIDKNGNHLKIKLN